MKIIAGDHLGNQTTGEISGSWCLAYLVSRKVFRVKSMTRMKYVQTCTEDVAGRSEDETGNLEGSGVHGS